MAAIGGTKPILAQRITQEVQTPLLRPFPSNAPHRILSIDMGIRNLALCLIHIPHASQIPEISDWHRLVVSARPVQTDSSIVAESFEPIDYAAKAYNLMKYSIEAYKPHTILIERQRYRSGGSAGVQEWTVRVNMLESMFHAVLHTLAQQHQFDYTVYSVSPRKITQLWLGDIKEKMNARETKNAKIGIAENIIRGENTKILLKGQAKDVAEEHISLDSLGIPKDKSKGRKVGVKKFDDLADALLQGLGWWKWHFNRSIMMTEILESEEKPPNPTELTKIAKNKIVARSRPVEAKTA